MKDGAVLTISAASLLVLQQGVERAYLDRLMDQVAALGIGIGAEEEMRARCSQLVRSGRTAGLTTELELAAYVACGFAFGSDFNERTPYREILGNSELTPSSKAEMLMMLLDDLDSNESDDGEDEVGEEEES